MMQTLSTINLLHESLESLKTYQTADVTVAAALKKHKTCVKEELLYTSW